ncbi:hypothetical protein K469DRAFT_690740 [Zopfia rhizophila CBS 207.26]|uniref:Uncharacterized protein n=1 Tax=Zopfia rhizophila CBS 207.26 TaxID=1314779 RepID=A0A6A6DSP2_9PEZI|nr:hypothetical protein K469DRAFT_690740 [Zopfia rhizophila CBS 207.26]
MPKPAIPKERIVAPQVASQSTPPPLSKTDVEIARRNGTTVAIEATKERMQASKTAATPSLTEIIYEEKRESGRLRRELDYERRVRIEGDKFEEEVRYVLERLRMAVINHVQSQKDIKKEYDSF